MKPTIKCADCGWEGNVKDLLPFVDGVDPEFCPRCGSDNMWDIVKAIGGKDGKTV